MGRRPANLSCALYSLPFASTLPLSPALPRAPSRPAHVSRLVIHPSLVLVHRDATTTQRAGANAPRYVLGVSRRRDRRVYP